MKNRRLRCEIWSCHGKVIYFELGMMDLVKSLDQGAGVAVLTDMFGGTPSNLALSLLDLTNVEVMAGVNLPMLIKLVSVRDKKPLDEAMKETQEAGKRYINVASHFLMASHE